MAVEGRGLATQGGETIQLEWLQHVLYPDLCLLRKRVRLACTRNICDKTLDRINSWRMRTCFFFVQKRAAPNEWPLPTRSRAPSLNQPTRKVVRCIIRDGFGCFRKKVSSGRHNWLSRPTVCQSSSCLAPYPSPCGDRVLCTPPSTDEQLAETDHGSPSNTQRTHQEAAIRAFHGISLREAPGSLSPLRNLAAATLQAAAVTLHVQLWRLPSS